jgi:hypothetical protein
MAGEAHCAQHPDRVAINSCSRCGAFFCAEDAREVEGKLYCETCAARPDVDWLEALRLKYWGKRDVWAWLVGAWAAFAALEFVSSLWTLAWHGLGSVGPAWTQAVADLVMESCLVAIGVCFWSGLSWARVALPLLELIRVFLGSFRMGLLGAVFPALGLALSIGIYADVRNELFFRVPVSSARLKRWWHRYADNYVARTGFQFALAGLILPPLAPIALLCSAIGLTRVNPSAHPPIGRKQQAIAGLVLGVLGTLWGLALVYEFTHRAQMP